MYQVCMMYVRAWGEGIDDSRSVLLIEWWGEQAGSVLLELGRVLKYLDIVLSRSYVVASGNAHSK